MEVLDDDIFAISVNIFVLKTLDDDSKLAFLLCQELGHLNVLLPLTLSDSLQNFFIHALKNLINFKVLLLYLLFCGHVFPIVYTVLIEPALTIII